MLLEGKQGLILGIANKRSLAWGIAQAVAREGARLAVTYQGERLEENVRELAASLKDPVVLPCDVTRDEDLDALAAAVGRELGGLDFVVHAVASRSARSSTASSSTPRARASASRRTSLPTR